MDRTISFVTRATQRVAGPPCPVSPRFRRRPDDDVDGDTYLDMDAEHRALRRQTLPLWHPGVVTATEPLWRVKGVPSGLLDPNRESHQ